MPNPKKGTPPAGAPTGGGGAAGEPPEDLVVPKTADEGPQATPPAVARPDFPIDNTYEVVGGSPKDVVDPQTQQTHTVAPPPLRVAGPTETAPPLRVESVGPVRVSLQRSIAGATRDQALWVAIRTRTRSIGFDNYRTFIERVLCQGAPNPDAELDAAEKRLVQVGPLDRLGYGVDAYQLLKAATEAFLILRCGVLFSARKGDVNLDDRTEYRRFRAEEEARLGRSPLKFVDVARLLRSYLTNNNLPYIDRILGGLTETDVDTNTADDPLDTAFCGTLFRGQRYDPCLIELIWSYWREQGMLVQAINAISLRFQNKRLAGEGNAFANLELHPLRPLSNLLWGYIQDEPFRLTVARRAYEYSHHYGLTLSGRAVPPLRPADHRSKFLEAFHALLHQAAIFYRDDSDTTVIANGFPLLNSLKEVHLLLAEGAHNQFGDLPWTARVEMLIQQWLLSRRELQDFLRGRAMVPYKEPWMGQVDTIRRLLGWGDTPVTHFADLGTYGEQILLSIRYGDWIDVDDEDFAKNWARYWKPEIQTYVHAYRAVTGVDLTTIDAAKQIGIQVNAVPPDVLLQRRRARQQSR